MVSRTVCNSILFVLFFFLTKKHFLDAAFRLCFRVPRENLITAERYDIILFTWHEETLFSRFLLSCLLPYHSHLSNSVGMSRCIARLPHTSVQLICLKIRESACARTCTHVYYIYTHIHTHMYARASVKQGDACE